MNDDDLLASLKKAAARDATGEARAPRWEALARGEADEGERRALEEIARADGDDDAVAALAPHDASRARALETIARARGSRSGGLAAVVRPIGKRARPIGIITAGVAGALAIAAAVVLWIGPQRTATVDDLPSYGLSITGGDKEMRSGTPSPASSASVTRLGPDAELRIVVRPERDVVGPVDVRLVVVDARGASTWNAPYRVSPTGAVEIAGAASTLFDGGNGRREIAVAVGRPGSVPVAPAEIIAAPTSARFVVFRTVVELTGRP